MIGSHEAPSSIVHYFNLTATAFDFKHLAVSEVKGRMCSHECHIILFTLPLPSIMNSLSARRIKAGTSCCTKLSRHGAS